MKKSILLIALVAAWAALFSQNNLIYDQSFRDTSFVRFKAQLMHAVLDRDTSQLFPLLAETVHVSDEQCSYAPKECLMNDFRKPNVKLLPVWDDLYAVISFGFSRTELKQVVYRLAGKGEVIYQAPSYLKSFDDNNYRYVLVLGQNVNIREKPSASSRVLGQASFEKLVSEEAAPVMTNGKAWYSVKLSDGRTGYIAEDFVSAGISKELSVKVVNGQWKIISFFNPPPKC